MKVVGLITEYNPFHNGHQYHIKEAKRITGADYVVVVMSGNFVQRGAPAFLDKYLRTEMALNCGADIVFELPVCYATSSAELFALGAISLLDKLGIVDYVCFGSESGEILKLTDIASFLITNPNCYNEALQRYLRVGDTFPIARMKALQNIITNVDASVLESPNNILGIEYIKALLLLQSKITPVTIARKEADYHSEELSNKANESISSATAIRKALSEENASLTPIKDHVPENVYHLLLVNRFKTYPILEDDYSLLLNYKLMQETESSLQRYTDITRDLANRIIKCTDTRIYYSSLAKEIKSRQWTLTRINRVLIHIILNLYKDNLDLYNQSGYTQYARILGLKKASSHLIRNIVKNEKIPVITKMGDATKILPPLAMTMLQEDIFASHLYNQIVYEKYQTRLKDEFTKGLIFKA